MNYSKFWRNLLKRGSRIFHNTLLYSSLGNQPSLFQQVSIDIETYFSTLGCCLTGNSPLSQLGCPICWSIPSIRSILCCFQVGKFFVMKRLDEGSNFMFVVKRHVLGRIFQFWLKAMAGNWLFRKFLMKCILNLKNQECKTQNLS